MLPCYNPVPGWAAIVVDRFTSLKHTLQHQGPIHCIVVNDGSSKHITEEDVGFLRQHIPDIEWISYAENRGKGYALRQGVAKATADIVLYTDIDFPYTQESMQRCLHPVLSGSADVALAVRNRSYYSKLPPGRRLISKMLRSLNRFLLGLKTSDTQGGLKAMNQKGKEQFLRTTIDRYLFDLEFVYKSTKADLRIAPVESDLREGVTFTAIRTKILWKESLNFLRLLVKRG